MIEQVTFSDFLGMGFGLFSLTNFVANSLTEGKLSGMSLIFSSAFTNNLFSSDEAECWNENCWGTTSGTR